MVLPQPSRGMASSAVLLMSLTLLLTHPPPADSLQPLSLFIELPLAEIEMNETLVREQSFDSLVLQGKSSQLIFFTRMEILKL